MPIDVASATAFLASVPPDAPSVPGAPARDLIRSPAARRVGELSAEAGLFLFHFEHRTTLELPDAWIAPGRDDDARPPVWVDGALPESKYQSFRHDLYLGSFHPGHRGKWTAHELCHGLVGTAWRPDATALFHATAARLAELLPVVLWYFLDECGLRRCPDHEGEGALFRSYCPDCEALAGEGWIPLEDRWLQGARDFLDRELAAIARSRRLGRPVPHRWATIDLATDGVAYAAAHGRRLSSPAFARFAERFHVGFRTLDALEARVVAVAAAICEGRPLAPGPGRWVEQDLAWRLLQIAEDTEGEAQAGLHDLVDRLADGGDPGDAIDGYQALHEDFHLPDPEYVFAVGYRLTAGLGRSVAQVKDGLGSVCPLTMELADDAGLPLAERFLDDDVAERRPLGERFADWLARTQPGAVAELARYEVALRTVRADGLAGSLDDAARDDRWQLARGAAAIVASSDLTALSHAVDAGEISGVAEGERLVLRGALPPEEPVGLLIGRAAQGEAVVVEVPVATAEALAAGAVAALDEDERTLLQEVGLLVPSAWRLDG